MFLFLFVSVVRPCVLCSGGFGVVAVVVASRMASSFGCFVSRVLGFRSLVGAIVGVWIVGRAFALVFWGWFCFCW